MIKDLDKIVWDLVDASRKLGWADTMSGMSGAWHEYFDKWQKARLNYIKEVSKLRKEIK